MYRIEEMEEADPLYNPVNGIEKRDAFRKRILSGINIALTGHDDPLIVSHGRFFLVLCELLNIPSIRQIPNTTLIECYPLSNKWKIKLHINKGKSCINT
jgi:broad specificity phosphatase PhoE